jgi:hypothetical protein
MGIFDRYRHPAWLLAGITLTGMASGLSPDPRIVSLIPPAAQIVEGSGISPSKADRRKLLILSPQNAFDLDDFAALAGVDESRFIRQVFMVSETERLGSRVEHSILAIGHFNQGVIFTAAIQNGARARDYQGFEILEILPYSRDPGGIKDLRWLAVIGSDVALFGTLSHVREELDRYADHVPVDPALLQRLARLNRNDETWCLLPNLSQYVEIREVLGLLDPRFLDGAPGSFQFEFGIRYGRRIRLDYEFTRSGPAIIVDSQSEDQLGTDPRAQSLIPTSDNRTDTVLAGGVISVSKMQYEKWLVELSARRASPNKLAHHASLH